jgi:ATP/maltotriose-dependent transcriptional regulator MalT/DNA-binding SARP family transcriptional activator
MSVQAAARIARPALARRICDGFDVGSAVLVAGAGYGKTTALEEAIELSGRHATWLACGDAGGEAGRLLLAAVEGLRAAVPGLADVIGDALASALEPVDVRSATAALLADLERLLVEPLVIVFDDAEELEGDAAALAMIEQLLGVREAPLAVAIATRRPLDLKLAKLRASGRLMEVGPAELSFTASQCEELLRIRHDREVSPAEVEAVLAASEGWPMGVALTGLTGPVDAVAVSREELFGYLAEEVFDQLDPGLRLHLVDSSVPDVLTPQLVADLDLPAGFLGEAERSGLFLRVRPSGKRTYHPLFRNFLRGRLRQLRSDAERAELHVRTAESLAQAGRAADAIGHWLAAERHEQALAALAVAGPHLARTSPDSLGAWLAALPPELRHEPDYLFLEAQLLWGAGRHQQALEILRQAVSGFSAAGNEDQAWLARIFLADTLLFLGAFDQVSAVAAGWEDAQSPVAAAAATGVAWFDVVALASIGRMEEAEALRQRLRRDPDTAVHFSFLDVMPGAGFAFAAGESQLAVERLEATIAQLELDDPFGRLPYALGMMLVIMRSLGRRDEVPAWIERCERESERVGLGFALRDFRLQRASRLAEDGDLPRAEAELARAGRREGTGWRGVYEAEAEAHVALLRGDGEAAVTAAQRALASVEPGPMPWRVLATVEMSEALIDAGAPALAAEAIAATMAGLDARFPAERGRLHRAWLLAARACLEQATGEPAAATASLRACWDEAGEEASGMLRGRWPRIRPVLWQALSDGVISPAEVLPAMQDAFPGGEALVAMVDHPEPAVRRAALLAALSAGHPAVLERLGELGEDEDEQVAAAAAATKERLRKTPPPLRFELLGGFRARRAGWELDEAAWQRPMAARVVRFLLIQADGAVPEDALFDAFWADRPSDTARQHLAVAVSRARKVLDLPGAEQSVIEVRERTYRLALRDRDSVDALQFEAATAEALADGGSGRRPALERAAELWRGEPLPEDLYAAWSSAWRERLLGTYCDLLCALIATYAATAEHDQVIRMARRLLGVDRLNEQAHRALMIAYGRTGRTSHALRQYLECRRALVVELGVEPAAETSQLQARILAGEAV